VQSGLKQRHMLPSLLPLRGKTSSIQEANTKGLLSAHESKPRERELASYGRRSREMDGGRNRKVPTHLK